MKSLYTFFTVLIIILFIPHQTHAQLIDKADELITSVFNEHSTDSIAVDSLLVSPEEKQRLDSIRLQELTLQVQEMKLNEIMLRTELDQVINLSISNDSIKKAQQRQRIDSLRALTSGIPLIIKGDTLFRIYAQRGGHSPADRVNDIETVLNKIGESYSLRMDSIYVYDTDNVTDIMYGGKVLLSITDQDGLWQNMTRQELANQYLPVFINKIEQLRKDHSIEQVVRRVLLLLLVVIIQFFFIKLTNLLFRKLRRKLLWVIQNKLKSIKVRDYEFLDTHKQGRMLLFFTNIFRYVVLLIQFAITIPIIFSIFPQTESLALKLFSYLWEPIKIVLKAIIAYIPNLFMILVIYFFIRYLIKAVQYFAREIENERLKINGFYPDWAQPTFNIIRTLMYVFMFAMIYNYLPGADSNIFQGISVFVGIIISLGSTTVIGNIMSGLVITYMRPFKIGDRIKLNDTLGNVIEKTPLVTRIRTPKNEIVTIPNSFIMSSHTTNYSESARQHGLIIHADVTYGYEVPWRKVHELLINAALATPGVSPEPRPFVLETELHDYYPIYQVNAYIRDADKLSQIYSDLYQSIQDRSAEAGIELLSPHYFATRDGNASTLPHTNIPKTMDIKNSAK